MSVAATTWAWSRDLPPHLKLTLLAIADHCNDHGYGYPGQERLAQMVGIRERALRDNLKALERMRLFTKSIRPGIGKGREANAYQLAMEATGSTVPDEQGNRQHTAGRATGSPAQATGSPAQATGSGLPKNRYRTVKEQSMSFPSESDSFDESLEDKKIDANPPSKGNGDARTPPCPHQQIIDLYHQSLPELPVIIASRWTGSKDAEALAQRGKEDARHRDLGFWAWFFEAVRTNPHWLGDNGSGWKANLRWLVKRANFDKVLEWGVNLNAEPRSHDRV